MEKNTTDNNKRADEVEKTQTKENRTKQTNINKQSHRIFTKATRSWVVFDSAEINLNFPNLPSDKLTFV